MWIIEAYITMMPLIIAGILNMIFCRSRLYKKCAYPIDGGRIFIDGRRVLGDNKTIIGAISMIVISSASMVIWGVVIKAFGISGLSQFYRVNENNIILNIYLGAIIGAAYIVAELPNSFIKRRLGIECGKVGGGLIGSIFYIIDQIDSLIVVFIILILYSNISIIEYMGYIILGAATHSIINMILYKAKIRRNI